MAACFVHGRFAFLRGVAAKVLSAREYELSRALGCYKVAGDRRYRRCLQGDWASGGAHGGCLRWRKVSLRNPDGRKLICKLSKS